MENDFSFKHYNPVNPRKAITIDTITWNAYKNIIVDMHERGFTRSKMLDTLRVKHDFEPTLGQLAARLKAWNLCVYQPRQGKDSASGGGSRGDVRSARGRSSAIFELDLSYAAKKAGELRFKEMLERGDDDRDTQPVISRPGLPSSDQGVNIYGTDMMMNDADDCQESLSLQNSLASYDDLNACDDVTHKHICPLSIKRSASYRFRHRRPPGYETPDTEMTRRYLQANLPKYLRTSVQLSRTQDLASLLDGLELFGVIHCAIGNWYDGVRIYDSLRYCQETLPDLYTARQSDCVTRWLRCLASVPHSRSLSPDEEHLDIDVSTLMFHDVEPLSMSVRLTTEGLHMGTEQVSSAFTRLDGWVSPSNDIGINAFSQHMGECANFEQLAYCLRVWCYTQVAAQPNIADKLQGHDLEVNIHQLLLHLIPRWLAQPFLTIPEDENLCTQQCCFIAKRTKVQAVSLLTITIQEICRQAFATNQGWMAGHTDIHTLLLDACQVRSTPQRSVRHMLSARYSIHSSITDRFKAYLVPSGRTNATRPFRPALESQSIMGSLLEILVDGIASQDLEPPQMDEDEDMTIECSSAATPFDDCVDMPGGSCYRVASSARGVAPRDMPMLDGHSNSNDCIGYNKRSPSSPVSKGLLTMDYMQETPTRATFDRNIGGTEVSPRWSFEGVTGFPYE